MTDTDLSWVIGIRATSDAQSRLGVFFAHLLTDFGAAFILVAWDTAEFSAEHLEGYTAMAVCVVEDGLTPKPNTIYIVRSQQTCTLENHRFRVVDTVEAGTSSDRLFHQLAAQWGDRAIGIVFAAPTSAEEEGLQAISQAGGVALWQSAETGEFLGFAAKTVPKGWLEEIPSPQELADTVKLLVHLNRAPQLAIDSEQLWHIVSILANHEHIDFANYKPGTLTRRILHRYMMTDQPDLSTYIEQLERSPEERQRLCQEILVGATSFFRDAPAWEFLATHVLPRVIDQLPYQDTLRVWVPACSTGEEAYSLAILIDEYSLRVNRPLQVKIFATDLDAEALRVASNGLYPERIAAQVSPERLERYFTRQNSHFQVTRSLREMLIIAPQDITRNAGFSKMHLVSCRNLLIYMQPALQQQVIRSLHFALNTSGILFLGISESLGDFSSAFRTLVTKWKIYQKSRDLRLPLSASDRQLAVPTMLPIASLRPRQPQFEHLFGEVLQACVGDRLISCFLINWDNQLLHVFHDALELLGFPVGTARLDLMTVIRQDLRFPVNTALYRAKRDRRPIVYTGLYFRRNGVDMVATLRVSFDPNPTVPTHHIILVFEAEVNPSVPAIATVEIDTDSVQQMVELEYELQHTRTSLQVALEELETTSEEQQATNEELLASNEELQSTNEELQAANEELHSINTEYQHKIAELTQLTNDIDNLLRSTNIGVVFLDRRFHLRKITPAATRAINLRVTDVDRPLWHFTRNFDCHDFLDRLAQVAETHRPWQQEVTLRNTRDTLLMQIHPYFKEEAQYDGLVITFVNINELKAAQTQLRQRTEELEHLYSTVPIGLALIDEDLRCIRANSTMAEIGWYRVTDEFVGKSIPELVPHLASQAIPLYRQVFETGEPIVNVEFNADKPGTPRERGTWLASYFPMQLLDGRRAVSVTVVDITARKQAEQILTEYNRLLEAQVSDRTASLQQSNTRFQMALEAAQMACWERDLTTGAITIIGEFVGSQWTGTTWQTTFDDLPIHPDDRAQVEAILAQAIRDRSPFDIEHRLIFPDAPPLWVLVKGRVITNAVGAPMRMVGVTINIDPRKQIELALQASKATLKQITDAMPGAVYRFQLGADRNLRLLFMSEGVRELYGIAPETAVTNMQVMWDLVVPEALDSLLQSIQTSAETLEPWHHEFRVRLADGTEKWILGQSVPQAQASGAIIWNGLLIDISDRKQIEADLQQSEATFRNMAANVPGAIFRYILRADGTDGVIYMSQGCIDLWEVEAEQVVESAAVLWEMIHPDDRILLHGSVLESAQTLQPWHWEWRITTPSGQEKWLEATGRPEAQPNGDITWVTVILDISIRKQAEIALAESETLFRSLFEQANVGIALCSPETALLRVNQRYCQLTGYTEAELLTLRFVDLTDPEDLPASLFPFQCMMAGEIDSFSIEKRYIRKDGSRIWVSVTGSLIRDAEGKPKISLGVVEDVSDRKHAEDALRISEQQFRAIFEHSAMGIVIATPPDYKLFMSNLAFRRLLGYSAQELMELDYQAITLPEDLPQEQPLVAACLAGQRNYYQLEKRYVRKDGQIIWVNLVISIIRDAQGNIQFSIGIVEDITARKQAIDLEISRNRDLKEAFFEESTDAVFLVDPVSLLTLDCNQRAVELFEVETKADLINMAGHKLQKHPFTEAELNTIQIAVNQQGVWSRELEYVSRKGNLFWGLLSCKQIRVADTVMNLVQVKDISDRKRVELDMRRNMDELERLNRNKDDFLSTVSHELRTPLTNIDMATRMLKIVLDQSGLLTDNDPSGRDRLRQYLQILTEQSNQERELIEDLLDLQRLNAETFEIAPTVIDLQTWLPPITQAFQTRAIENQQQFQLELLTPLPTLISDPQALRRILVELLNNACKYTPANERITLTVATVELELEPPQIQFQLCNTGVEIPPDELARIFEPFYRLTQGDRWSKRGTGLGLTLTQQLTTRLGGALSATSTNNQVCFVIRLAIGPSRLKHGDGTGL